ncbi:MAG: sulfotransferase [Acidobacteriota bacterium]
MSDRLEKAPIFLNCLSRGGSNLFWNLFLTHPDVCSPILETLEIFRAGLRRPTLTGWRLALLAGQPRLFDSWWLAARKPIPERAKRFLDQTLHARKLDTVDDTEMRFKAPETTYDRAEVASSRLCAKNNNGLAFLSDILFDLYPDAVCFALVRDPVALYESHKRRGISKTPEAFAHFFNTLTMRHRHDSERFARYHLVRFEDLLADPITFVDDVYRKAELDGDKVERIRLKSKTHFRRDGSYGADRQKGAHYWLTKDEVVSFLEPQINQLQASKLDHAERARVRHLVAEACDTLGYPTEEPAATTSTEPT